MMLSLTAKEKELDYFLEICGGFLMTGGQDVSPSVYDEMEQYILKGAVDRDKSVLGICRGIQFMSLSWAFNGIRNFLMRQMKTAER